MEQRLIDANAIKLEKGFFEKVDNVPKFYEWLDKQPTVDAVPVVHAYWIIKPHGTYGQLRAFCSACGKHSGIGGIVSNQKKPYCPNCGAIMDWKEIVDG